MASPTRPPDPSTTSGLRLDTVYENGATPELPGVYPFTRGIHADMYRGRLWTFRQYAGFGSAAETNGRFRYLLDQGQTGLSVAFDLPTQIGYDSDDAIALGEVGKVGVPISTLDDLDELFADIPLDAVSVSMTINSTAAILIAFLVALAERRGIDPTRLRGTVQNDLLKEFISRRTYRFPLRPSLRLVGDVLEYSATRLPRWNPISISGYHMREAGANAVQEIAFTLSNGLAYAEEARRRGMDLTALARRLSFFFAAHNHLFEEVAKFRAARRLWARLARERLGITDPDALKLRFHTQTAGSTLTFQEPANNAVRVTVQALAAVLGGTQSLHTNGIDEALGLPSRDSARTALRTQQILAYESGVADVADPLGGSPLVEELTDRLEDEARRLIGEIDALGGAVAAVERGFQKAAIEDEAWSEQKRIESGERVVVGVNRFLEEAPSQPPTTDRVDPRLETERLAAIAEYRRRRGAPPAAALGALRDAARGTGNLVPRLIDAAQAGATLGEMVRELTAVFGEHRD